MYYVILTLNLIFLIYLLLVLMIPRKMLFFIKDKEKRNRIPYIFILLGIYVILCLITSPIIESTPERKAVSKELEFLTQKEKDEKEIQNVLNEQETELNFYLKGTWIKDVNSIKPKQLTSEYVIPNITFNPLDKILHFDYRNPGAPAQVHNLRIFFQATIDGPKSSCKTYYGTIHRDNYPTLLLFSNLEKKKGNSDEYFLFERISQDTIALKELHSKFGYVRYYRLKD